MQSNNKNDSLTDNLWAEMSLMMVLVVIVLALRGDTSGNSHSPLYVVRCRQRGKLEKYQRRHAANELPIGGKGFCVSIS
jgi:hypothetical protein